MKKIILLSMAVAMILPSCQKSEGQSAAAGDSSQVVFTSAISTRATDTSWDDGDQIGVYMYETANTDYAGSSSYNVLYTTSGGESGKFTSLDPLLYIDSGVDFIAYHPYIADLSNVITITLNTADQSTEELVKAQDFMVASAQDCTESSAPTLNFTRKMSKISVKVVFRESTPVAELSDISLSGAITDGTYLIVNSPAYRENYSVKEGTTYSDISLFYNEASGVIEAIIIPQERALTLNYTIDGVMYRSYLYSQYSEDTLSNYTLSIGTDSVDFSEGSIGGWTEVEYGELETTQD